MAKKSKYSLVGIDGNAYAIMAYVRRALINEGVGSAGSDYVALATKSDYSNLVAVSVHVLSLLNEKEDVESYLKDKLNK